MTMAARAKKWRSGGRAVRVLPAGRMTMAARAKGDRRGGGRGADAAGRGSRVGGADGGRAGEASGAAQDDQRRGLAVAVALLLLFVAARLAWRALGGA